MAGIGPFVENGVCSSACFGNRVPDETSGICRAQLDRSLVIGGGGGSTLSPVSGNGDISVTLSAPEPTDNPNGEDYRTPEFMRQPGLALINADGAYTLGYFGQGVTVAIVDTGVQPQTASSIAFDEFGDRLVPGFNAIVSVDENNTDDIDGQGTFVAGVVAAERNSVGMHGVAPSASILPLKLGDDELLGNESAAYLEGARRGALVFNSAQRIFEPLVVTISGSLAASLTVTGLTLYARIPYRATASAGQAGLRSLASNIAVAARQSEAVYVWAAGDEGWHAENDAFNICEYDPEENDDDDMCRSGGMTVFMSPEDFLEYAYQVDGDGRPIGATVAVNSAGFYSEFPLLFSELQDRWLAVVSTDNMDELSPFSNGCGMSKYWCLAAPGQEILSIDPAGTVVVGQGTGRASAPHVSGALALIKSRFPNMPMAVARAILLTSAEDLGDDGIDDIFGWGRLDVGRAVTLQGNLTIRMGSALPPREINLPPPNPPNLERDFRTEEFGRQYGLSLIAADAAYWRGYFGQGVTIAVVDTGMLTSHVEMRDNAVAGVDFGEGKATMTDPIADPLNSIGHGTFVAGIIGAAMDGSGMHGVAPSASIMPMKFSDRVGNLRPSEAINAITTALRRGAHVVNNSWHLTYEIVGEYEGALYYAETPFIGAFHPCALGPPGPCAAPSINPTLQAALDDRDSIVVWVGGNDGFNAENGMVRLCADIIASIGSGGCPSGYVEVSSQDFIDGFVPQQYTAFVISTVNQGGVVLTAGASVTLSEDLAGITLSSLPNITTTSPGFYARAPIGHPELQDNWLVAVATDQSGAALVPFSNGCGDAKFWCLAAPGLSIYSSQGTGNNDFGRHDGTSFSAPHVSGALALLKSRLPHMPMDVVRAVLLYTADDLGDPGVDDIYGWGLVNMERAITLQGRFNIVSSDRGLLSPSPTSSAGVNLQSAGIRLPHAFSHVEAGLADVSVAIGGVGNAHYNAPLSDFVQVETVHEVAHADAAADMLGSDERRFQAGNMFAAADAKSGQFRYAGAFVDAGFLGGWSFRHDFCDDCIASVWPEWQAADAAKQAARQAAFQGYDAIEPALGGFEIMPSSLPFFARESGDASFMASMRGEGLRPFAAVGEGDAPYRQYGLRWRKSLFGGLGLLAEASEVQESETFWGADFGALGQASARTRQARLFAGGDLNAEWRGFGGYEASFGSADAEGGALLQEVSGMRSSELSAGLERRDVFSWGDALRARVSWRRVSGGEAVISHAVADEEECDFTCAFYGSLGDTPEYLVAGEQELESRESRVSLSSSASWSAALGYAFRSSRKSRISLGASHASAGTTTFSAAIRAEF